MKALKHLGLTVVGALTVLGTIAVSDSDAKPHDHAVGASEHTLREVMQHLQAAETELQTGLMTNNRLMIRSGALRIADHPAPKGGLKPYIKKNHAKLMDTIKLMDAQVHQTAKDIAAKSADAPVLELVELNHKMISGCVGCHNMFRD